MGVNPKQFFTFREGGTAYTFQGGSNSFGQYLSVTELKVDGLRRTIIIPAGKFQQGWKTFGIELRRRLEPSQYALGGLKFVPYKSKQIPKYHAARSFVEAVKAPMQARLKPAQQPFIKEKAKDGVVEKIMELPRDNDTGRKFSPGSHGKSHWLGRGLIVDVNEFGKRRVSWDGVKRGKQASKWVATGSIKDQNTKLGLGPSNQNAQGSQLGSKNTVLGLGLSSPSSFEAGGSSFSGPPVLEPSDQRCLSIPSPGKCDLNNKKKHESLAISLESSVKPVMMSKVPKATSSSLAVPEVAGEGGHNPSQAAQPSTMTL
nr:hypothetical protein CFP56_45881 [Quercus suber]POF23559.1 hypothetical protein CFP56_50154 [Quercus suber]